MHIDKQTTIEPVMTGYAGNYEGNSAATRAQGYVCHRRTHENNYTHPYLDGHAFAGHMVTCRGTA